MQGDDWFSDLVTTVDELVMVSVQARDGTIVYVNERFCEATGYAAHELRGQMYREVLGHPDEPACDAIAAALAEGSSWRGTLRQRHKAGRSFWTEAYLRPCIDEGEIRRIITIQRDISHRIHIQTELDEALKNLDHVQQLARIGSWQWDFQLDEIRCSPEALRIFGLSTDRLVLPFQDILARIHPEDREFVLGVAESISTDRHARRLEFRVLRPDGTLRNVSVEAHVVRQEGDTVDVLGGTTHDITERHATDKYLKDLALRDPLTGLLNRRGIQERLEHMVAPRSETTGGFAVLFLDMDGFKNLNDKLGHDVGDSLLRAVADRLREDLRAGDDVGRLGGDEFVILLRDVDGSAAAEVAAQSICRRLGAPYMLGGQHATLSVSIGIAVGGRGGCTASELLRNADIAMYQVKRSGRNGVCCYKPGWGEQHLRRLEILHAMPGALERGEFELHYQPQICLHSGQAVAAEALLRWRSTAMGLVSPGEFIPLLEDSGEIENVGRWVLLTACRDAAEWARTGQAIRVAVNVSYRQLQNHALVDHLRTALSETGLPPEMLELEITESMFGSDAATVADVLRRCREIGVSIAVDDFGTGYSSLGHLKRFPVNVLKIDKVFTEQLEAGVQDAALVSAIVGVAKALNLTVIAEGIERPTTAFACRDLGCEIAQGYLYSAPLPKQAFEQLLRGTPEVVPVSRLIAR